MTEQGEEEPQDIVPGMHEIEDGNTGLTFGIRLSEADGPRPRRKGTFGVFMAIAEVITKLGICGLRWAYGRSELPLVQVHDIESKIRDREEESRRRNEKHALELEILRTQRDRHQLELEKMKALAEQENRDREQALDDAQYHLAELLRLGVTVNVEPIDAMLATSDRDESPSQLPGADKPIEELSSMSVQLRAFLSRLQVTTLKEAAKFSERELLAERIGKTELNELKIHLGSNGLRLRA